MICAFYSYKGGVGRSMALANVARWLTLQGLDVLMVDWDLEAPGLEEFFYERPDDLEGVRGRPGLIDLLLAYKRNYPSIKARLRAEARRGQESNPGTGGTPTETVEPAERLRELLPGLADAVVTVRAPAGDAEGSLRLLTAGWRAGDYAQEYSAAVQAFDWSDFYASYDGEIYFEWLRRQFTTSADVVLIDSRTGVTEMGGVCTRQLADVVVSMSAPNRQNLRGLVDMLRSFRRSALLTARGRALDLVVVPTRVENSEISLLNAFARDFSQRVDEFTPAPLRRAQRTFWDLRIPYVPRYAYGESLVVGAPDTAPDLERAYKSLATHLMLLAPAALVAAAGPALASAVATLAPEAAAAATHVVIAYAASDGRVVADIVAERLHTEGDATLRSDDEISASGALESREGTSSADTVIVAVITPGAVSGRLPRVLSEARRRGTSIVAVQGVPKDSLDVRTLPAWLQAQRIYDPYGEWDAFIRALSNRQRASKLPLMAPEVPTAYITRPDEYEDLVARLITPTVDGVPSSPVVIVGGPGMGKTTLVAAVARDERVLDTFFDGVLWTTVPMSRDPMRSLTEIYVALTPERPTFLSVEDAAAAVQDALEYKRCLIVLDDVLNEAELSYFLRGGRHCARLITSRNVTLLRTWSGIEVGPLTEEQSVALLRALGGFSADAPALVSLADRLDRLPLALRLAGDALRSRTRRGDSPAAAIGFTYRALDQRGVSAFDRSSDEPGLALSGSLDRSLNQLKPEERLRCAEIAAFPKDVRIPLTALRELWALDELDTEALVERVEELGLVRLDLQSGVVEMHGLVRELLRQSLNDVVAVEKRAVDALNSAAVAVKVGSSKHGARRAVCVGIDGYVAPYALAGCVNDARSWSATLQKLGFDVQQLFDRDATRARILGALGQLIASSRDGDVIVFQFAGHGTQVDNLNADEYDSLDEAFCPVDFDLGHLVLDDDIRELFSRLPPGVNLTCFLDCCYSGTITRAVAPTVVRGTSDRRGRYIPYSRGVSDRHRAFASARATRPAKQVAAEDSVREVVFSACQPHEVAYEADGSGQFTARAVSVLQSGAGMTNLAFFERVTAAFGSNPIQHPMIERGLSTPVIGHCSRRSPRLCRRRCRVREV